MTLALEIETRLREAFAPTSLEVLDESEAHRGHGGYSPDGSHFRVRMVAEALEGKSRVAKHRAVNAAVADLFPRIHALAIEV
ncbi:BolA family protein [Vannielia litorea]|uniref:BolA family protein n=1 Tax=Vannielia litorea TaxID=1217970 RepID=UPI001C94A13B|nr:BolA family protein [Vannielia litorea]MBY6046842.1 BolA family transcriptional regulator [Vannielia litorea]MBY6074256.1 BolA family transcriptional regulator [Vannielia litorea]